PFFVVESLRSAGVPATIRDAVLARASRLEVAVREFLELAAVVPGRIDARLLADVLSPSAQTVEAAMACGLLVAEGRSFAYRHELARIAMEQSIPGTRRAQLHARLLERL